jgi:hypothetical protein
VHQAFWWGGVAALARNWRTEGAVMTASPHGRAGTTTSTSSSGNEAAKLCPSYHRQAAWPANLSKEAAPVVKCAGGSCLELLLLREVAGQFSWAQQQLQPFRAGLPAEEQQRQQLSVLLLLQQNTEGRAHHPSLSMQWPLMNHIQDHSSSSSSSSGGSGCHCRASTCHLCTPLPPVNLQQLRLVLEVVCLTCTGISAASLQAPLLLALLLQRASTGTRAAFLNSADGVRLLVALQQMAALGEVGSQDPTSIWSLYNLHGALSVPFVLGGTDFLTYKVKAMTRAVYTLAWCFLEVDPGSTAAAGAAAAAAAGGSLMGPAAVANGAVLNVPGSHWTSEYPCGCSAGVFRGSTRATLGSAVQASLHVVRSAKLAGSLQR